MSRTHSDARPAAPPVADVREFAREHAELSSLRILAPQIGIKHSTLHNFLGGANPHPRIWRLLREWYARARGAAMREQDQLWRVRARMRAQGVGALSASELLAVLFAGGDPATCPDVNESQKLLGEFSPHDDAQALRRIMDAGLSTVAGVRRLDDRHAAVLLAGLEIGRRAARVA